MNRKIIAFTAAVLMTASLFTACGGDKETAETTAEPVINVITPDGETGVVTTSPEELPEGVATVSKFSDPADAIVTGSKNENVVTQISTGTVKQEDVINMIQNGVTEVKPVLAEYNIDCTTRYGYQQLNSAEQALYKQILEAVKNVKLKVQCDESVTDEMWIKVYGCMYMQEPELFWLSSSKVQKGKLWYWEVDPDLIAGMQKEIDASCGKVLGMAEGKSTYEKIKVFHDYICLNNNFVKEPGFNQTIYGGFVGGSIQCEGYAKTMQYLCDLSGIESTVVVGTNEKGDTHAWNVIKVDGAWYNVDCTWDDPILSKVDTTNVRYRYFMVPDEWIHNKSHFNVNQKVTGTKVTYFTPPACTSSDLNYFKQTSQLYSDKASADSALKAKIESVAKSKLRAAEIRVDSKKVYDEITSDLKGYADYAKGLGCGVTKVSSNCDENTLVIELDLEY